MELVKVSKDAGYAKGSKNHEIKPSQKYELMIEFIGKKGHQYSAYFSVIIQNEDGRELTRFIKWFNDFSNIVKNNSLVFTTPDNTKTAVIVYRINIETPVKGEYEIELPDIDSLKLKENNEISESYDNIEKFEVPKLQELTSEEENILEKNTVWIFSPPRSGTTWLGSQLLVHPENAIWFEPWIGFHLGMLVGTEGTIGREHVFERVYDMQSSGGRYFFSPHHKQNWMPALRKFILTREYSEVQTIEKNVIIKEPVGSHSADIIMESMPNSKLIFLMRDGRDVLESRMDMHGKGTWGNLKPIKTPQQREYLIKRYSYMWNKINERIERAYQNHNSNLRLIVKYEELKNNTLQELRKIYEFIGIKISDEELKNKIETHDFKKIPESQKGKGKFYRAASTGSWKDNFSQKEQNLMNSIMGETLKKMGYEI